MIDYTLIIGSLAVFGLLLYWWDKQERKRFEEWEKFDQRLEKDIQRANRADQATR